MQEKEEIYSPEKDVIFRCIFGQPGNEAITKAFMESILGYDIPNISLNVNPNFIEMYAKHKHQIADVRAVGCKNGEKFILEMQRKALPYLTKRFTSYNCRAYVEDFKISEEYSSLKKTILIAIISENLSKYKHIKDYHLVWDMRNEKYPNNIFDGDIEVHTIELPKYLEQKKEKNIVNPWLEFIIEPYGKEVEEYMRTSEELRQAVDLLKLLNSDPLVRRIAMDEEFAEMDRRSELAYEREEAIKETAKKMLEQQCNIELIEKVTGLTKESIEELKESA